MDLYSDACLANATDIFRRLARDHSGEEHDSRAELIARRGKLVENWEAQVQRSNGKYHGNRKVPDYIVFLTVAEREHFDHWTSALAAAQETIDRYFPGCAPMLYQRREQAQRGIEKLLYKGAERKVIYQKTGWELGNEEIDRRTQEIHEAWRRSQGYWTQEKYEDE